MNNKALHMISFILLVVGGLNWLGVAVLGTNVVENILGMGMITTVVYVLVGLSALYELVTHKSMCSMCKRASSTSTGM